MTYYQIVTNLCYFLQKLTPLSDRKAIERFLDPKNDSYNK